MPSPWAYLVFRWGSVHTAPLSVRVPSHITAAGHFPRVHLAHWCAWHATEAHWGTALRLFSPRHGVHPGGTQGAASCALAEQRRLCPQHVHNIDRHRHAVDHNARSTPSSSQAVICLGDGARCLAEHCTWSALCTAYFTDADDDLAPKGPPAMWLWFWRLANSSVGSLRTGTTCPHHNFGMDAIGVSTAALLLMGTPGADSNHKGTRSGGEVPPEADRQHLRRFALSSRRAVLLPRSPVSGLVGKADMPLPELRVDHVLLEFGGVLSWAH